MSKTVDNESKNDEYMTLAEIKELAKERNVPGPDVDEHDESYNGECYCMLCLSYM